MLQLFEEFRVGYPGRFPPPYLKPAVLAGLKVYIDSQGWKVDWQYGRPLRGKTSNKEWAIVQHVVVKVYQHFQHPHPNLHKNAKYDSYAKQAINTMPSIIESMNRHAVCEVELGYFKKTVEEVVEHRQETKRVEVETVKEYDLGVDENKLSHLVMAAMEWRMGHKRKKWVTKRVEPIMKKWGFYEESFQCRSKGMVRSFLGEKGIQFTPEQLDQAWSEISELKHPDNRRARREQWVEVVEKVYVDEEDLLKLNQRMKEVGLTEEDIHSCRRNFGLKVVGTMYQHKTSRMQTIVVDVPYVRTIEKTTFVHPTAGEPRKIDFSKEVMRQLTARRQTPLKRYLRREANNLVKKSFIDSSGKKKQKKKRQSTKTDELLARAGEVRKNHGHASYLQARAKSAFDTELYVPSNPAFFNSAKLEYLAQMLCWKADCTPPLKHRKFKSPRDRWWKICHGHS